MFGQGYMSSQLVRVLEMQGRLVKDMMWDRSHSKKTEKMERKLMQ
jgi:hypothetical protein